MIPSYGIAVAGPHIAHCHSEIHPMVHHGGGDLLTRRIPCSLAKLKALNNVNFPRNKSDSSVSRASPVNHPMKDNGLTETADTIHWRLMTNATKSV